MVWYVSACYDVSIIGYCRGSYGMLVWYGMLEWYDVSMLWYVILVGRVSELFTGYEMEVETHAHVHILNQLGFHELQLHAITWVENCPPPHVFMAQCV